MNLFNLFLFQVPTLTLASKSVWFLNSSSCSTSVFHFRWVCEEIPDLKLAMENYVLIDYDTKR